MSRFALHRSSDCVSSHELITKSPSMWHSENGRSITVPSSHRSWGKHAPKLKVFKLPLSRVIENTIPFTQAPAPIQFVAYILSATFWIFYLAILRLSTTNSITRKNSHRFVKPVAPRINPNSFLASTLTTTPTQISRVTTSSRKTFYDIRRQYMPSRQRLSRPRQV
jgi:hypothetical protein